MAGQGTLAVCTCETCGSVLHPPRGQCTSCNGAQLAWKRLSGKGLVYSFIRVQHGSDSNYEVPYTSLLVSPVEHPEVHLFGHLAGNTEVAVGDEVEVCFDDPFLGAGMPNWRLVRSLDRSTP